MKRFIFAAMFAILAASCIDSTVISGNGKSARGAFDLKNPNYTGLSVSSGITVILTTLSGGEGYITADEEVLKYVSITEEGGMVRVSYETGVSVRSRIETVVTVPISGSLASLRASSASKIACNERLQCSELDVNASSAAEIDIVELEAGGVEINLSSSAVMRGNVSARTLGIDVSSAAKCSVSGNVDSCEAGASSGAQIRSYGTVCRKVSADASSGGSIEITASEEMYADVSSGGSVRYKGTPMLVHREVSSGGVLRSVE